MQVTQETINEVQVMLAKEAASTKMSAQAAARLRAQSTADKQRKADNESFVNKFKQMPHDVWTMLALLRRIAPYDTYMPEPNKWERLDWDERHAWKLRRCLALGWEPAEPHDLTFFARLTAEERQMSVEKFYREMTENMPTSQRKDGLRTGNCRAGKSCLRFERRKPGQAPEGQFCSPNCRNSFLAVQKRSKSTVPSTVN